MAEQPAGDKILPASPRKIEQAREWGQVAKSQDLSSAVTLLVALLGLLAFGPQAMRQLLLATRYYLSQAHAIDLRWEPAIPFAAHGVMYIAVAVVPLMLVIMAGGIAVNVAQVGIVFSSQAITPKIARINPFTGFQRFFSLRTFVELVKSLVKLSVISYVVWLSVRYRVDEIVSLISSSPAYAAQTTWALLTTIWWRIALVMLAIGLLDFAFQRWQYLQDLRMTRQEAQEELKQLEGDPKIKQRIKAIQRQMAMQRMMADVPEADVIITNPTTYAVAVRYDVGNMDAPHVIAKGARLQAERIRSIAVEHDVPIVERAGLAKTLYRTLEIGQAVPEHLFKVVAEVLAYVYQIDRREAKVRERALAAAPAPAAT